MAYRNKVITNPVVGQAIKFLQTGEDTDGKLLEMEATYQPQSKEPAPHYHPYQEEDFVIISGEMTVRIDGELRVLKENDTLHVAKNKVHSMWNNSSNPAKINWKVRPVLLTDHFLETAHGLANDGKTNKEGMPNFLQVTLMANKFGDVFRLASAPWVLQKIVFVLFSPLAYFMGYRPTYKKYLD